MQHSFQKLGSSAQTKHQRYANLVSSFVRTASIILLATTPSLLHAANIKKLMNQPGFSGMVIAIVNLNRAMESAAQNPMDDLRRRDVQLAMQAMPGAIVGLAQEFKKGNLHDGDLAGVQKILGGFVDVSAPKMYERFMKNPTQQFIPQVGNEFPRDVAPTQGRNKLVNVDPMAQGGVQIGVQQIGDTGIPKEQLAQLKAPAAKPANSLTYDETAKRDDVEKDSAQRDLAFKAGASGSEITQEIAQIEARYAAKQEEPSLTLSQPEPAGEAKSANLSEEFIGENHSPKSRSRVEAKGKGRTQNYRLSGKPKFWALAALAGKLHKGIMSDAHANGGEGGGGGGGGQCGGGGDCGGGGGGEGGGKAAEILMALAMVTAAAAPMIAAAISADADVKQTAMTTAAQERMAERNIESQQKIADMNNSLARDQVAATERINITNQQATMDRLNMNLAETRAVRLAQEQASERDYQRTKELEDRKLAVQEKEVSENLKLTRQTLNLKLMEAGLKPNYESGRSGSGGISTERTVALRAAGTTVTTTGGALTPVSKLGNSGLSSTALVAQKSGKALTPARGLAAVGSNRLLASLGTDKEKAAAEKDKEEKAKQLKKKTAVVAGGKKLVSSARGFRGAARAAKAYTPAETATLSLISANGLLNGSTTGKKVAVAASSLGGTIKQVQNPGFGAYYRGIRRADSEGDSHHGESETESVRRLGAYNEPATR